MSGPINGKVFGELLRLRLSPDQILGVVGLGEALLLGSVLPEDSRYPSARERIDGIRRGLDSLEQAGVEQPGNAGRVLFPKELGPRSSVNAAGSEAIGRCLAEALIEIYGPKP